MRSLELKIPPPLVALLIAAAMWSFSATGRIEMPIAGSRAGRHWLERSVA